MCTLCYHREQLCVKHSVFLHKHDKADIVPHIIMDNTYFIMSVSLLQAGSTRGGTGYGAVKSAGTGSVPGSGLLNETSFILYVSKSIAPKVTDSWIISGWKRQGHLKLTSVSILGMFYIIVCQGVEVKTVLSICVCVRLLSLNSSSLLWSVNNGGCH